MPSQPRKRQFTLWEVDAAGDRIRKLGQCVTNQPSKCLKQVRKGRKRISGQEMIIDVQEETPKKVSIWRYKVRLDLVPTTPERREYKISMGMADPDHEVKVTTVGRIKESFDKLPDDEQLPGIQADVIEFETPSSQRIWAKQGVPATSKTITPTWRQ